MQQILIIGNGIAGITAARHIRKLSEYRITVVSGETDYFFSRTALMYIYMGHMEYHHTKPYEDWFWEKNRIELVRGWVSSFDFEGKSVSLEDGSQLKYDKLILALGSRSNFFGWQGQDLKGVQGLYSYQDLQKMEQNTRDINHAVVVGGGLIGVEMAEMLHSRHIPVTYLVREPYFWGNVLPGEESKLIGDQLTLHGIDMHYNTELVKINGDRNGKVASIETADGSKIPCQYVGITVGVSPNIEVVANTKLETSKGILVDQFLETNINDVFSIGDCAELRQPLPHRRAIEPVWYVGRMMGETVARTICGDKTAYVPGVWFNSAKFFNIEYQTYGRVPPEDQEGFASFFWKSKNSNAFIRISYEPGTFRVLGVNLLGIRSKHVIWEQWIKEERSLGYVIQNLSKANFDPEFHKKHEAEIQEEYNWQFPSNQVQVKKRPILKRIFG